MNGLLLALSTAAATFAVLGGIYGAYRVVRRAIASRPYRKPLPMFAGTNELRDALCKLRGRTVNFDTAIDFSVATTLSSRIAGEAGYGEILGSDATQLNGKSLPLYVVSDYGTLDSFARLVVCVKDGNRLKYSHGGTGITQVLLIGRFAVEVRAYSGPSVEITLREV
jgi:hypothetical protein